MSRDGSKTYASAITEALPSAIQVADRWHLLKGLFEALKHTLFEYLPIKWTKKKRVISSEKEKIISPRKSDQIREKHADEKWKRILDVQQLHQQGKTIAAIARQCHVSRGTVYKYLKQNNRPDLRRSSICDPFWQSIQSGVIQGKTTDSIEQEIRKDGYSGSRTTLDGVVAQIRRDNRNDHITDRVLRSHLLYKLWEKDDFNIIIRDTSDEFLETFPKLKVIHEIVQSFRSLVRNQDHLGLELWIAKYEELDLPYFQTFIQSVKGDLTAVKNALHFSWNNGILEGEINKLKTIKRMMYGRANHELLKRRILFDS